MTRRTRGSAAELEDESTPIRPRTDSVGFIDTPIGMGPATTLMSPRRYNELGAVGVELTTEPARAAALPGAAALPVPPPRDRHHALRDSVSLETDDDSASTSVIMDSEYVMLDDQSATVIQSSNQTDHPPPTSATGATGIRRIPTGTMYPSIIERMDIDLTVCKSDITGLETQAIQQVSKMEWMQQEPRMAREDRQEMAETIEELKNQVMELTTKLENSAVSLKSLRDVCTFRATDFHAMINDLRQQQRDLSAFSSIEPVPPPPPVADTRLSASVHPSAAHEQSENPSAPQPQVPVVP